MNKNINILLSGILLALISYLSPLSAAAAEHNPNRLKLENREDIDPVFKLGEEAYKKQEYEKAITIFKKIITKFPGYADAHYYIGLSFFGLGEYYQAIASFLEANKIYGSERYDALFGAALSYLSSGYIDEARAAFQKVIKESNDPVLARDSKEWLDSIEEQLLQKEKIELLSSDLNFREGVELLESENYNGAENSFRRTLDNRPNSVLALYYLGNTLYLREKYNQAVEAFEKILLIDPESKIAADAKLYIRVITELTSSYPNSRQYYFQVGLGTLYDSNLSYADQGETIIRDAAGAINMTAGYIFNSRFQGQYNYYGNLYSGINDNTPGLNLKSSDFNLQRHNINAKYNYPFFNNLLGEIDYSFNWYVLGGNNFLFNNRFAPKLNYYISPDLITVVQYNLDLNNYPVFETRNSAAHSIDLSQYYYLFDNSLWLRGGYNFQAIFANDRLLNQSGLLTDGNEYNLEYNFINSLISNDLFIDLGFNTIYNSKLVISAKVSFNDYTKPDIYRLSSPTTNIATGETEIRTIKDIEKERFDILYNLGLNYSIPLYSNITANLTYNFLYNNSNITRADYIGRSYIKHLFGLNLSYQF